MPAEPDAQPDGRDTQPEPDAQPDGRDTQPDGHDAQSEPDRR